VTGVEFTYMARPGRRGAERPVRFSEVVEQRMADPKRFAEGSQFALPKGGEREALVQMRNKMLDRWLLQRELHRDALSPWRDRLPEVLVTTVEAEITKFKREIKAEYEARLKEAVATIEAKYQREID
jgi:hypothetical protein